MKTIQELILPDEAVYTDDHEWAMPEEGNHIKVGITDYAQDQLGDIVFVELPAAGETVKKGDVFGTVESVKAVAELFAPADGKILEINGALEDSPELVNSSPYEEGWLVRMAITRQADLDALMNKDAYLDVLQGLT